MYVVAEAIGTEARAVFNNASRRGDFGPMKGASCFAPFINIMRHPLWGRVQVSVVSLDLEKMALATDSTLVKLLSCCLCLLLGYFITLLLIFSTINKQFTSPIWLLSVDA